MVALEAQHMDDMDDAEDMDDTEDMDLEAIEDIPSTEAINVKVSEPKEEDKEFEPKEPSEEPTEEPTEEPSEEPTKEPTQESPKEPLEERSKEASEESTEVPKESFESTTNPIESKEETTETVAILFEEMENMMDPKVEGSSQPSIIETTTAPIDSITSEYNGFDGSKSDISFSCYGRPFGQYADVMRECRVFHLCYPYFNATTDELLYQRISFLCDNDSVFDQKRFICVENSTVDHKCSDSEALYLQTNQEYLIRIYSQHISPIDEMRGQTPSEENLNTNRNWFSWLNPY